MDTVRRENRFGGRLIDKKNYIFVFVANIYFMRRVSVVVVALLHSILFFLLCPVPSYADYFLFRQLSIAEGFPPSIQTVYSESNGLVWIGTKNGLGQFDGYTLKTYIHSPENPHSLPGNEIYQIIEDSLHRIWVLTNSGTALYRKHSDSFLRIQDENRKSLLATAACCTDDGLLFITRDGLYRCDGSGESVSLLTKLDKQFSYTVHELWKWNSKYLLCVNKWRGVSLLELETGRIVPAPFESGNDITHVLIDGQDRVWTTSYNKGIVCFDKSGKKLAVYNTANSRLSHDVVLCLSEHSGEIWAGTDGGGINVINPADGSVTCLAHRSGDRNSLPVNSIQCLYQSKNSDYCWAGSIKGGLINICHTFIRTFADAPLNTCDGLTEKAVLTFYQEPSSGDIWVGTDGGGINRFNPKTQKFVHYPKTWGEKVVSISGYTPNELLVSIFSKGIFIFNKTTGGLEKMNGSNSVIDKYALYARKAINLYQDNPSSTLILSSEIYRYFPKEGKVKQLTGKNIRIERQIIPIDYDSIYTYLYDSRHVYTIGRANDEIEVLYTLEEGKLILSASKDMHGNIWMGTNEALCYYDREKKTTTFVQGPWTGKISLVVCDKDNHVWIGCNDRLFMWIIDENRFISFDESDGAVNNEYLDKAAMVSAEGDIYMGGINGMLCIDRQTSRADSLDLPVLSLTDVLCNNQSILAEMNFEDNSIRLSSEDRNVTLRVMAHESNILRKRRYRWFIEGVNEQIIESNIPEMTLHLLVPGVYQVSVSCDTKDGRWTARNPVASLIIPPPWYRTWWFLLLCIALVAGIIIFIIITILHRKEELMASAIKEHKQKINEEKVRFLININHELRTPLTLIHTPLKYLLKNMSPDNSMYPTLKSMLKQSVRMKELLNMVLNLRRMEMTQEKLNVGTYPLNEWIREVGGDFAYEEQERNIHLKYELDDRIGQVDFDKEKHLIVLTNLIINALKHSPKNSDITVRTELSSDEKHVRISVSDQGCGLEGVDTGKLFTRFYQGKNEKEGSGIGLSYARILVELHHGHIDACNNPDKGACFFYELPVCQDKEALLVPPQEYLNTFMQAEDTGTCVPLENSIDTHNYSCLFVDDNEDVRNLAVETFKDCFKNLYIASDGEEALQIALRDIPDIVVSDVMMPNMSGYELCRRIKENLNINHIQVILLTARIDEQSHIDGYRTGADAYLEKPFEVETLMATIVNRLFLREQIRQRYSVALTIQEEKTIGSADDAFLFRLNKLIAENMDSEGLSVGFICQEMGTSRASFYNRLKSLTNLGPNEYINKMRMEKAMALLRQTDLSITEVAEQTGFSSGRYFSTAFKKFTGTTPSQYKEEQKKEADGNLKEQV